MRPRKRQTNTPVPTRTGLIVMAAAVAGLAVATLLENNAALLLACLTAGVVASSFVLSALNLRGLEARRSLPDIIFAGSSFTTEIVVHNTKSLLPSALVLVRDRIEGTGVPRLPSFFFSAVPHLPPSSAVPLRPIGMFFRRGRKRFTDIEFSSRFPLGLFRTTHTVRIEDSVVVYPRLSAVSRDLFPDPALKYSEAVPVRTATGDEEFAGLREFRPGDNPKWIHWKSSGRLDEKLLVRDLERNVVRHVVIRFEPVIPEDAPQIAARFERALRAAASLAHDLVAGGYSIDFEIPLHHPEVVEVHPNDHSLYALLEELALLDPVRAQTDSVPDRRDRDFPRMIIRPGDFESQMPIEEVLCWE